MKKEIVVIACYRPKKGKEAELLSLMQNHLPVLKKENLVTDRKSIIMRGKDGTILEVFEWKSKEAIDSAHTNPNVLKMWEEYAKVCDFINVGSVPESKDMFPGFEPLN